MNSLRAKCVLAIMIFGEVDEENQPSLKKSSPLQLLFVYLGLIFMAEVYPFIAFCIFRHGDFLHVIFVVFPDVEEDKIYFQEVLVLLMAHFETRS